MWMDDLAIVRRYLRDPAGNIWTDAVLRHLWNDVQSDLQHKTLVLEQVSAQRVPDLYHVAYQYDWEWLNLPDQFTEFYQCLQRHDQYVFCHSWEPQEITSIASDTTDVGVHFTQPWEAFMGLVAAEEIRMKFPRNLRAVKYIAYDEQPIVSTTRKFVQSSDSSYLTSQGTPVAYYPHEALDKSYVLYPVPSVAFVDEVIGDGVAFFVEDDSEDVTGGTIAIRTGSSETANSGVSVDVVEAADNVLIVYEVAPREIETISDESDFPQFLTRYVRFGVLGRAFAANTDGRNAKLAQLWASRYAVGVNTVRRYMRNRHNDRDYRLTTKPTARAGRRRLPRLPSTYPAV